MSDKQADQSTSQHPAKDSAKPSAEASKTDDPKLRKTLPMVSVPDDDQIMAEEMAEMFDEDRVSHQHGSSEPEAD